jgi:hypothetical protein
MGVLPKFDPSIFRLKNHPTFSDALYSKPNEDSDNYPIGLGDELTPRDIMRSHISSTQR